MTLEPAWISQACANADVQNPLVHLLAHATLLLSERYLISLQPESATAFLYKLDLKHSLGE